MQKLLSLIVLGILLISIVPIAFAAEVPSPYNYVMASIGDPESIDPAKCYDQASGAILFNMYETLVFWDEDNLESFIGLVAEDWTISGDGLTYTFNIRQGIPWHDPAYGSVTAEDVEYSLERVLVLDYSGGPEWMMYVPLLQCYHADLDDPDFMQKIDDAITRDGETVTLHLAAPAPWMLHVLSNVYGPSVMCKQWCIDHGDWDGTHTQAALIANHRPDDPWMDLLDHSSPGPHPEAVMGCGPYKFDYWDHGVEWALVKFDDYWRGWPNPETSYLGQQRRGYVEKVTYKMITDWAPRRDGFKVGDYDSIYVPLEYKVQVEGQPGIECLYPYASYGCTGFFFNYNVSTASPYLGVEGGLPYGTFDEFGVPPDFFSDINVRKAFAHSCDYDTVIADAYAGEAIQPVGPLVDGLGPEVRNLEQTVYTYDIALAEDYFKAAYGGELWTTGFTSGIAYNTGNVARQTIAEVIATTVESINPLFHVPIFSVDWGSVYIPQLLSWELNMFIVGWGADYPHPDNFIYTFMGRYGDFSYFQNNEPPHGIDYRAIWNDGTLYGSDYVEARLEEARLAADPTEIYYEMQEIYYEDCPGVVVVEPTSRRWHREWIQGWYYNGIYSGSYCYAIWKEDLPTTDLNEDGQINILDIFRVAKAFGASFAPGFTHPRWDPYADINSDRKVNIVDIFEVARVFGWAAPEWTPP